MVCKTKGKREHGRGTVLKDRYGNYRCQYYDKSFTPAKRVSVPLQDEAGNPIRVKREAELAARKLLDGLQDLWSIDNRQEALSRMIEQRNLIPELEKDFPKIWTLFTDKIYGEIEPSTLKGYQKVWKKFTLFVTENHGKSLAQFGVTIEIIDDFFLALRKQNVSPSTYNNAKNCLCAILKRTLGKQAGELFVNYRYQARTPRVRKDMKLEELQKMLAILGDVSPFKIDHKEEYRCFIRLMAYCGMRGEDAAHQSWENIDFQRNTLSYIPIKNRKTRPYPVEVPLHPELRQALWKLFRKRENDGCMLPHIFKRYHQYEGALGRDITRIMKAVGIETTAEPDQFTKRAFYTVVDPKTGKETIKTKKVSKKSMHSIRHYFATKSKDEKVDRSLTQEFMTHESSEMTDYYTHYDLDEKIEAINALPGILPEEELGEPATSAGQPDRDRLLAYITDRLDSLSNQALFSMKEIIDSNCAAESIRRAFEPVIPEINAANLASVLCHTNESIGRIFNISGSMVTRYLAKFGLPRKRQRIFVDLSEDEIERIRQQMLTGKKIIDFLPADDMV